MNDPTAAMPVQLEIPLRTMVAIGLLVRKQGADPKSVQVADLVENTLTSMVEWFVKKQAIQMPPEDDLFVAYQELFVQQVADPGDDFVIDGFTVSDEVEARVQAQIKEKELSKANRDTKPAVVPDVQKPGKIDLFKVNRASIDTLMKLAPKDVILEKIHKGLGEPVHTAAVEIVYTSLPLELWGTATAEQAIADMVARHESPTVQ